MPLPTWIAFPKPATGPASRTDINAAATPPGVQQATLAAAGAPLRLIYGSDRVGALIADALVYQGNLVLVCVWGEGEVDAIESFSVADQAPAAGVTATHYRGTAGQTADPLLVAAYAAQGVVYTDTLPDIAYSVVKVPSTASAGWPTVQAVVRGLKIYDPRTGLTAYSDNPSLAAADYLSNTRYGRGRSLDWASVTACANVNDDLVGGEKRRIVGVTLANPGLHHENTEALRTYAGAWVTGVNPVKLIADRPRALDHVISGWGGAGIVEKSMKLKKRGLMATPTVVEVRWVDTSVVPWAERTAYAYAPGVEAGTTPRRLSSVALPGIHRHSQAVREAVERLNHFGLEDLELEFTLRDEAMAIETGDVAMVFSQVGLAAKYVRITATRLVEPGRYRIAAREYDAAAYSDSVEAEPSWPDTQLPDPSAPPVVTGLSAEEEVYQLENGTFSSRLRATWDAADYPYLDHCRVEILEGGANLIQAGSAHGTEWTSPAVQEGVTYTVRVAAVTAIGAASDWASATVTAQGKYLLPGDVPWLAFFEVNGRSYLSWGQAADIDIWRYRLKYGPVGGDYASANDLDLIDGLRYQTGDIPAGTWVIYVKAVDSVRQESPNAATVTGTVTLDSNAYLVDTYDHTAPSVSGMAEYSLGPWDASRHWVTEDGRTAAAKFPDVAATYGNTAASYHNGSASAWWGESEDFGLSLSGTWTGMGTFDQLAGAGSSHIETSDDAAVWRQAIATSELDTARFARLRHKSDSGVIRVALGAADIQQVRLAAIPRSFEGDATSSASGPVTITLPQQIAKFTAVDVQPIGAAAMIGQPDNLVIGAPTTFDAYVFDTSGNKVAAIFKWTVKGVG